MKKTWGRAVLSFAILAACASAPAAVFTVSSTNDTVAAGTLRWAINNVNTNLYDTDQIRFSLASPYTIIPTGTLPTIFADNVTIAGDTQPGYSANPLVKICGAKAPSGNGLNFAGSTGSFVRAVQVSGWPDNGITMDGPSEHCTVEGCWVLSNGLTGIMLVPGNRCTIGGLLALSKNVISENGDYGVQLYGSNNTVLASYIGCDPSGLSARPNDTGGIAVFGLNHTIGSTSSWARNIISGNNGPGITIQATATNVLVIGNYIGTDFAGSTAVSNTHGIRIEGWSNSIGGGSAGTTNVISGNMMNGIWLIGNRARYNRIEGNRIGLNATGAALGNGSDGIRIEDAACDNVIGGTTAARRNVISGNRALGVNMATYNSVATTGNVIRGNYIGTDLAGMSRVPNESDGIRVSGPKTLVGGPTAGEGNLVSGNGGRGIWVDDTNAWACVIQRNVIGLDASGVAALSNASHGIHVTGAPDVLIGGTNRGNIISGNGRAGIRVERTKAVRTMILGNLIGVDGAAADTAIPNGANGIDIQEPNSNTIGGTVSGTMNLISGNTGEGILLNLTTDNRIIGNMIGMDALAQNPVPNSGNGICVNADSARNTIEGNMIGGNGGDGIDVSDPGATHNTIRGNWIGTDSMGVVALGNGARGIRIYMAASNTVGGFAAGQGNLIANNGLQGIAVLDAQAVGNRLLGNELQDNVCLGIRLELGEDLMNCTVTTNDPGDGDPGGNRLQNYPVILSATNLTGSLYVVGTMNSTPNSTFWVQLYGVDGCQAHGYGEGDVFLGVVTVRTAAAGIGGFTNTFAIAPPTPPNFLSAIATDTNRGDTSEFSKCVLLDRDRDGMGDGWENEHFGSVTGGDPAGHGDTDTIPNVGEFLADTDPGDSNSFLRCSIALSNSDLAVSVPLSSAHRQYDFQSVGYWSVNPTNPPWGSWRQNELGTGGALTLTTAPVYTNAAYRVWAHLP